VFPSVDPLVFEYVFGQSPIGEYLLTPSDDPVILAVNDAFLRASGRARESLVGQRLFVAFPGDPHDTGDTTRTEQIVEAALHGGKCRGAVSRKRSPRT
jgi:hypothetical protein